MHHPLAVVNLGRLLALKELNLVTREIGGLGVFMGGAKLNMHLKGMSRVFSRRRLQ